MDHQKFKFQQTTVCTLLIMKISRYLRERKQMQNRQRKILSLEERVQAIHLYDQNPVYMHVASAFQCSWEQIKNVIQDRDAILDYYARCQTAKANDNPRLARQKKINFLGKVMYEYIKRVYFYRTGVLNDMAIRDRALMFRDILKIESFVPNKAWISDFKQAYNLDFEQLDVIAITQQPPQSTNCEDIVAYCSKNDESMQPLLQEATSTNVSTAVEPLERDTHVSQPIDLNFIDDVDNHIVFEHAETEANDLENDDSELESDDDAVDFNENEDGPTIDFGDFDHNVEGEAGVSNFNEPPDLVQATQASIKTKRIAPKSRQIPAMEPQASLKEIEKAAEVQQTPTNGKPRPSGALPTAQLKLSQSAVEPPTETTSFPSSHGSYLNSSLRKRLNHDGYAAALEILLPLEEYALLQEDFPAINLLSQLMTVYRRGIKRKMHTSP